MKGAMLFAQRGAALAVSLIMLVLITLMVIAALNLGTSNFRAVSNTQFREQAIAAANVAIQDRISSELHGTGQRRMGRSLRRTRPWT